MKYFAIINDEQKGPFELSEFPAAHITPETYVWCKGMSDWQPAGDVADICRFYRNRIFDIMHPQVADPRQAQAEEEARQAEEYEDFIQQIPVKFQNTVRKSGHPPVEPLPTEDNFDSAPPSYLLPVSIILVFFSPLACIAVYFSILTSKAWRKSNQKEPKNGEKALTPEERDGYRRLAHDYGRSAKMWIGLSFFIGMIFWAWILS